MQFINKTLTQNIKMFVTSRLLLASVLLGLLGQHLCSGAAAVKIGNYMTDIDNYVTGNVSQTQHTNLRVETLAEDDIQEKKNTHDVMGVYSGTTTADLKGEHTACSKISTKASHLLYVTLIVAILFLCFIAAAYAWMFRKTSKINRFSKSKTSELSEGVANNDDEEDQSDDEENNDYKKTDEQSNTESEKKKNTTIKQKKAFSAVKSQPPSPPIASTNLNLPSPSFSTLVFNSSLTFLSMSAVAVIHSAIFYYQADVNLTCFFLGSFGASATLICAFPALAVSQPRNVLGGHLISAVCGLIAKRIFFDLVFAGSFGIALALGLMQKFQVFHPPAGSTALIMVVGSPVLNAMGWFALLPIGVGSIVLCVIGLMNNLGGRKYPVYWW